MQAHDFRTVLAAVLSLDCIGGCEMTVSREVCISIEGVCKRIAVQV